MNRIHEKHLRIMIGVKDPKAVISERAKRRIEQVEARMTRLYGRFMEMTFEALTCLMQDLDDDRIFIVPKPVEPPKPTPEEYIAKMTRGSLEVAIEDKGIEITGKESIDELRTILLESVKKKEPEPVKETE